MEWESLVIFLRNSHLLALVLLAAVGTFIYLESFVEGTPKKRSDYGKAALLTLAVYIAVVFSHSLKELSEPMLHGVPQF